MARIRALSARLGPPSPNYEPLRRPRSAARYQGHEYLLSFPTEIPPTEQQREAACRSVLLMRQAPQRHRNVHFDAFVSPGIGDGASIGADGACHEHGAEAGRLGRLFNRRTSGL